MRGVVECGLVFNAKIAPERCRLRPVDLSDFSMSSTPIEQSETEKPKPGTVFERAKHLRYLQGCMRLLPASYAAQESNRLTLLYFVISGLDILDQLDVLKNKDSIIDWIYSLQVLPDKNEPEKFSFNCGFRGSPFFGCPFNPQCEPQEAFLHDQAHVAMTYTALCILLILGDDLSRVNKQAITAGLRALQMPDGSICSTSGKTENDMRFVFAASAVSTLINDWSGIDIEKTVSYIKASLGYEFAFGQGPGQESHGGSTYCAVAALALMNRLDALGFSYDNLDPVLVARGTHSPPVGLDKRAAGLLDWLSARHVSGFQGRLGKEPDSCYSWWIGSTIHILMGGFDIIDEPFLRSFLLSCQHDIGGCGKYPDVFPDVLHTYFSLCGFAFLGEPGLQKVHCGLGLTVRSAKRLAYLRAAGESE